MAVDRGSLGGGGGRAAEATAAALGADDDDFRTVCAAAVVDHDGDDDADAEDTEAVRTLAPLDYWDFRHRPAAVDLLLRRESWVALHRVVEAGRTPNDWVAAAVHTHGNNHVAAEEDSVHSRDRDREVEEEDLPLRCRFH